MLYKALITFLLLLTVALVYFYYYSPNKVGMITDETVVIVEGDVVLLQVEGKDRITYTPLVEHSDYPDITGFWDLSISPNKKGICFHGSPIAPVVQMYYSDIDGSNVTEIGYGKGCKWSPDSSKIAFIDHVTDVSPVSVYVFEVNSKAVKTIWSREDSDSAGAEALYLDVPNWVDNHTLVCDFILLEDVGDSLSPDDSSGRVIFNLLTGETLIE
jgi:hypothetical protein